MHAPWLVAVISVSLDVIYLNETGRAWINPNSPATCSATSLPELTGVAWTDAVRNEWVPRARVLRQWSGDFDLRDSWGGEIPAHGRLIFQRGSPETGDVFLFLACRRAGSEAMATGDRALLRALLETVPEAIYFKDSHSRFLRVSRALALKDGIGDPSAFIGKTDFDRFTVEHAQVAYQDEQRIIRTAEPMLDREEKETWPDGRVTWVSTSKFPLRDDDGRIVGTFGISRDITRTKMEVLERQKMEAELQLAQKLESIGRLAAGIAHEVNTPTQFITDNTRFLQDSFAQIENVLLRYRALADAVMAGAGAAAGLSEAIAAARAAEQAAELGYLLREIPQTLQQSLEGLQRIARIVCSMKEFSHPSSPHLAPTDINRAIETAITVSRHEWKYVADMVMDFAPDMPPVPCLVDTFGQVILNLVINAAHAIQDALRSAGPDAPRQGTITVRTRHDASCAYIEIADTGTGIPASIRDRIFEPFFTTKGVGKGTGQGLSIVRNVIVRDHHGAVDFLTEEGRGTTFQIRLPLVHAPEPSAVEPTQSAP